MIKRNEWEEFFDGHAPEYMNNSFTQNTLAEVDFIIEELDLPQGSSILDVGCGTGRHSIELARRGYVMTGVDISSGMLAEAQKATQKADVEIKWIKQDATRFQTDEKFDAAICLCEGALGLLGTGGDAIEHNLSIMRNINRAVRPGGKLILTVINGLALVRKYNQKDVDSGRFDPDTLAEVYPMEYDTPQGKKSWMVRERGFVPTELVLMLRQTGFEVQNVWGGTAGKWGQRKLELDEMEIMVTATKTSDIA